MIDHGLGTTIKTLREINHIGARELARQAGISASNISNIESGFVKAPSIYMIQAIAQVLGITVDDLLSGKVGFHSCPTCNGKGFIKDE